LNPTTISRISQMDSIRFKAEQLLRDAKSTGDPQDLAFAAILRAAISLRSRGECIDLLDEMAPNMLPLLNSSTEVIQAILDSLPEAKDTADPKI
jgi:hypothetical protein